MKMYKFVGLGLSIGGHWMGPILPLGFGEVSNFDEIGVKITEVVPQATTLKVPAEPTEGPNMIEGFVSSEDEKGGMLAFMLVCKNFGEIYNNKEVFTVKKETILDEIEMSPPTPEEFS